MVDHHSQPPVVSTGDGSEASKHVGNESPVSAVVEMPDSDDGDNGDRVGSDFARGNANNRLEIFQKLTAHSSLDRCLERPHITGRSGQVLPSSIF